MNFVCNLETILVKTGPRYILMKYYVVSFLYLLLGAWGNLVFYHYSFFKFYIWYYSVMVNATMFYISGIRLGQTINHQNRPLIFSSLLKMWNKDGTQKITFLLKGQLLFIAGNCSIFFLFLFCFYTPALK